MFADTHLTREQKRAILMLTDSVMIAVAICLSYLFLEVFLSDFSNQLIWYGAGLIGSYLLIALLFKVFWVITRFTSSANLIAIGKSLGLAHLFVLLASAALTSTVSLRFFILAYLFSLVLVGMPRVLWRRYVEKRSLNKVERAKRPIRTLLFGAGSGGEKFLSTVKVSEIDVVGFIDDDSNKQRTRLLGKEVLGSLEQLPQLVAELAIAQVIITSPSLSADKREEILTICNRCGVEVFSMPKLEAVASGQLSVSHVKPIDIADLLNRDENVLDKDELGPYFSQRTVLITGAGGSIGSEICRQVAALFPKRLLLLGHGENSIYQIHRELTDKYQEQIEISPIIADIQDRDLIFEVMDKYQPDFVYHAAAHKHVPLMEYNPREAVKNNIFGTQNVAEAAKAAKVSTFVMVSTDKAVNPPNVMGATKRLAEMVVTNLNEVGETKFVAVRFGNVLGSRGSVVPNFKEQIAKGGPVTVTDFRMTRYFMTIPEASSLVIQAGYLARGGELFVLDMGKAVLIRDLAEKLIKLSGHTVEEIGIVETGIRPGEKLYEEVLTKAERVSDRVHEKIFIGRSQSYPPSVLNPYLDSLMQLDDDELKASLIAFVKQE